MNNNYVKPMAELLKNKVTFALSDALELEEFKNNKYYIPLGKNDNGDCQFIDLSQADGILVGGTTGSGKSSFISSVITSLLFKCSPEELGFIFLGKTADQFLYSLLPHNLSEQIFDNEEGFVALNWAVGEMARRYKVFAESEKPIKNIKEYNAIANESLPQLVIFIDEVSELTFENKELTNEVLLKLIKAGKDAGICIIAGGQVVDLCDELKNSFSIKIAMRTNSLDDSVSLIGEAGAEKLLGYGQMLVLRNSKIEKLQGASVDMEKVVNVINFVIQNNGELKVEKSLKRVLNEVRETFIDELCPKALKHFIEIGQASVSLLQRDFELGYSKASKIVDWLEENGYISHYNEAKPRDILITKEQFIEKFGNI